MQRGSWSTSLFPDRAPDPLRRKRDIQVANTERRERVNDGVRYGGRRSDRPRFADALHAEGVRGRGGLGAPKDKVRDIRCARDRIVHKLSRKKLAVLIVDSLLHERRADRLSDSALHLAFDQKRVHLLATIVDRHIFQKFYLTGVSIHLHRGNVRSERERAVGRLEETRCLKPRLESGRQVLGDVGLARELTPSKRLLCDSFHEKLPIFEIDLLRRRLQKGRGKRFRLFDDLVDRHHDRRTAKRRSTAAIRVATEMGRGRVSAKNDDILDRDTESISCDLRKARLLALPMRRRTGDHRYFAGDLDPDAAPFPSARGHDLRRTERAYLNVGGNADPEKPARFTSCASLLEELRPIGKLLSLLQRCLVVSAVIVEPGRSRERELRWLRHVFQSHLYRVETELAGNKIHDAFDQVRRFGPARATVGVRRHFVRVDARDVDVHGLKFVATAMHESRQRRDPGREKLPVRPDVGNQLCSNREQRTVFPKRYFVIGELIAAVDGRRRVFATALDPLDWPVDAYCKVADYRFFRVEIELRTESAADLRGYDPEFVFRDIDHAREERTHQVRNLG